MSANIKIIMFFIKARLLVGVRILKGHWMAVVLAIVLGFICVSPQLIARNDSLYRGIQMFGTDAEYDYVANINQARYDDYSQSFIPPDQGKDYYLAPMLGERAMMLLGKISGLGSIGINVTAKFIFPAVLFLVLYAFFLEMLSLRSVALVAPLFIVLGSSLVDLKGAIDFLSLSTSVDTFLPYTRPVNPQMSSIFMFICLWLIYRLLTKKNKAWLAIIIGSIAGLSLYVYVYTWSFIIVFFGICGIGLMAKRDWERFGFIIVALITNILIVAPFFANIVRARLDGDYLDTVARIGLVPSHEITIGLLIVMGFLALIFLWPRTESTRARSYLAYILISLVLVLNQQLITGVKLQPGHFHWYIAKPFFILIIAFLAIYWARRIFKHRGEVIVSICLVFLIIISGGLVQINSYHANYDEFLSDQRYAPVLAFLNSYSSERNTIWAETDLSTLILAYTHHKAPNNLHSQYYNHSQKYLQDILFLDNRLSNDVARRVDDFSESGWPYIASRLYGIESAKIYDSESSIISELSRLAVSYDAFQEIPLSSGLKELDVDTIIVEKGQGRVDFNSMPSLMKIGDFEGFSIYQFK